MDEKVVCRICLDEAVDPIHMCSASTNMDIESNTQGVFTTNTMNTTEQSFTCKTCFVHYLNNKVSTSFSGTCPILFCPSHSKTIIDYSDLSSIIPNELTAKYEKLADSLLMFLCGGCHISKSLCVESSPFTCATAKDKLTLVLETSSLSNNTSMNTSMSTSTELTTDQRLQQYLSDLIAYSTGKLSLDEFHLKLQSHFIILKTGNNIEAWEVFINILRMIRNPERRNSLHLRYLRERPKFYTPCCSRAHCFRCKTKEFHENKSCEENTAELDGNILPCPACGITLAKADGCNTVTCVCGNQFSWATELQTSQQSSNFIRAHPGNTAYDCAHVLCGTKCGVIEDARGWQRRNRHAVDEQLLLWWSTTYSICPSQCCVLRLDNDTEGAKEGRALWIVSHPKQVRACEVQRDISIRALFEGLVCEADRAIVAYRLLNTTVHSVNVYMMESARIWAAANAELLTQAGVQLMQRSAMQFLHVYGNTAPYPIDTSSSIVPHPSQWSLSLSNPALIMTNDNRSVTRPGSASCYPAAIVPVPAPSSIFTVTLTSCVPSSNWVTFGLARAGFTNSSSDGVGRGNNSWGISDDRSQSCSTFASLAKCGEVVKTCRKLLVGDRLTALCDLTNGWVEIALNDTECRHRFDIPPGNASEYVFAATLANDHTLTILDEGAQLCGAPCHASSQHLENYSCFIRYLKKLSTVQEITPEIEDMALKWEKLHGASDDASLAYSSIYPLIDAVLKGHDVNPFYPLQSYVTWKNILYAECWNLVHAADKETMKRIRLADEFYAEYGDSAPFVAASMLLEFHVQNLSEEDKSRALCFMQVYSEEQHSWYDYNDCLEESMLAQDGKAAHNCRCLPRHFKECTKKVRESSS